jgi:hypothetical protein
VSTKRSLLCPQNVHYCVHKQFITVSTKGSLLCSQKFHYCVHKTFIAVSTNSSLLCPQKVHYCVHKSFITVSTKVSLLCPQMPLTRYRVASHTPIFHTSSKLFVDISICLLYVSVAIGFWLMKCFPEKKLSHRPAI